MADNNNYTEAVARHLVTKLHRTGSEVRCRCGRCRHQVLATARRAGLTPTRLEAALPREGRTPKARRRRRRGGYCG